ncbi:hypothetical protein [Candidatus Berkiella aquae]|uniref:Uncharacterized protein n=1 Tax=Candidatus Berkiella aquae TaxID=295108 RepID=A0A0Q9YSE4_9GAMM|nr:hypothetical protein [Candidatus Berkiella aquae]MCS5710235.1 hypothetical protein [Candidatus Berkiella aquae]
MVTARREPGENAYVREAEEVEGGINDIVFHALDDTLLKHAKADLNNLRTVLKNILAPADFAKLAQRDRFSNLEDLKSFNTLLKENLQSLPLNAKFLQAANVVISNIENDISKIENIKKGAQIFSKSGNYEALAAEIEKIKPNRLTKIKNLLVPGAKKKSKKAIESKKKATFDAWQKKMTEEAVKYGVEMLAINDNQEPIRILNRLDKTQAYSQLQTEPKLAKQHNIVGEIGAAAKQLTTTVAQNAIADFFENESQLDERTTDNQRLNQHVKNAFDYAAKLASFDIILEFVANAHQIYQFSSEHREKGIDLEKKGFKRLQEPGFKEFMIKTLDNLGFDIRDPNLLTNLHTLSPEELSQKREAFANTNTPEAAAKFTRAKDLFLKECETAKSLSSSREYYMLMSLSEQALLDVESTQRKANVTKLLPDIDNMMGYNQKVGYGVGAQAKYTAREMLKNHLGDITEYMLESANNKRAEARDIATGDIDNIRNAFLNNEVRPAKKSIREANKEWQSAIQKATAHDINRDVQKLATTSEDSVDRIMLEQFQKAWQKEAIELLALVQKSNPNFYLKIDTVLRKEIDDLKYQNAPVEVIQLAEARLREFTRCLATPHSVSEIKKCSLEQLKILCTSFNTGLNQLSTKESLAAQSIDEQQKTIAMRRAFSSLGTSLTLPETAFAAYDELVRNDRARLNHEDPGFMMQWISEKGGRFIANYLQKNFEEPRVTLAYLLEQKMGSQYKLAATVTEAPITASFSHSPQTPVAVEAKQTWFQWGASLVGLELDDLKLQQKQAINYAEKLNQLSAASGAASKTLAVKNYEQVFAILEQSDAIIARLKVNAAKAKKNYQAAQQLFDEELPAKQTAMRSRLESIEQDLTKAAAGLKQPATVSNADLMLKQLQQAKAKLETELKATENAFQPHKKAYSAQGRFDFSKTPEYAGLASQIEHFEKVINENTAVSAELTQAHDALKHREAEITQAMQKLIENPTSTDARLVSLYLNITEPNMASNFTAMKKEMDKLLESIDQDVAKAKEKVEQNPRGYFFWTTSQAAKDAETELQQVQQIQAKMQMIHEEFVHSKGQEPLVNIEIAKELQKMAPTLIFDETKARAECQQDYSKKCAVLARRVENMTKTVHDKEPYFDRPSLLESHAKSESRKHKNAIKYQNELKYNIETVNRMSNLANTVNEIEKDRQNGQEQIAKEQGFTYNFVYYMLEKYFKSGASLKKTAFNAIVGAYAGTLLDQTASRADALNVVLVHHLGPERAAQIQGYLQTVQAAYNFLQAPPLRADASWKDVAMHGLYAGAAAGVTAAIPAALWALPSGPAGMLAAGTVAAIPVAAQAGALAVGASLLSPVIAGITQEAVDYALKRTLGPKATTDFYNTVSTMQSVAGAVFSKADKITMDSVKDWYNNAPDKENINQVLISEGQKAFRGQTFDAFVTIISQLHELSNQEYLAELGLERLRSNDFAIIKEYMMDSLGLQASDLVQPLNQEQLSRLREAFIVTPTPGNRDPFATLMNTVSKEYNDVVSLIQQGKLKDSSNYVSIITLMNDLVSKVDMVQKATKAAELFLPDVNTLLATKAKEGEKTLVQYLTENAALDVASMSSQTGIAYMVQDSVTQATRMATNIVTAAKAKSVELEALAPPRSPTVSRGRQMSSSSSSTASSEQRASSSSTSSSPSRRQAMTFVFGGTSPSTTSTASAAIPSAEIVTPSAETPPVERSSPERRRR